MSASTPSPAEGKSQTLKKCTNAELRTLIIGMQTEMKNQFAGLNDAIAKVSDRTDKLESDVFEVTVAQKKDREDIDAMTGKVTDLERTILNMQVYSRKYHLLIYGVEGHETKAEDTIRKVREFGTNDLKLGEDFVKNAVIRNAHRLKPRDDKPAAIIVVFLHWAVREAFLRAGTNLRGTGKSIRTDLPPVLKARRYNLAKKAYELRTQENMQTRIREKVSDIWLEVRHDEKEGWTRLKI